MYTVYCHTNKINGKKYVGITKQKPEKRWNNGRGYTNSCSFGNAINKYGWEEFSHEILFTNLTREEAEEKEKYLIAKWNTTDNNYGYNISSGGSSGYTYTDEAKAKMSEKGKLRVTDEFRKKMGEMAKNTYLKHKDEFDATLLYNAQHQSEESRLKISEHLKKSYAEGKHPMQLISDEKKQRWKEKIKKAYKKKSKHVTQLSSDGKILNTFESLHDMSKITGFDRHYIATASKTNTKAYGFYWKVTVG